MKSKSWKRCGELILMSRGVHQSSAPGCPVGRRRRPKMQNNSKVERKFDLIRELKGSVHGRLQGLDQSDGMGTHLDINLKRFCFLKG